MGESGEGREGEVRVNTARTVGAVRISPCAGGVALHFPTLRAAGSALMLALFGGACSIIGLAAISGLVFSSDSAPASLLALAFAGVFALPLLGLGQIFIVIALWTAANSLQVEVSRVGLATVRRWFGFTIYRRMLAGADITAIESRLAAKYVGAFGATRYYRLVARAAASDRPLLIADSLRGADMTEEIRQLVIEHLALPALATGGRQAHIAAGDAA